ncbi:MAG: DNA polymerase III subunit epsilon [Gammaproteobacteria bacterium]|nr:DNA polymerase III subunit epsilon [Gammaproteobacteria bacterium]
MRQIVLDTETTGLDLAQGHRIIEIGCVELINRRRTDNRFQRYLQPDREIDEGASAVHGITNALLADKPRFGDVVEEFIAFIRGAELVIHNADFDVAFLNHELKLVGDQWGQLTDHCTVIDTLTLAREMHPGQRNTLDALCKRYGIDNSQRVLHGALLDAEILADVYLVMTGGQATLLLDGLHAHSSGPGRVVQRAPGDRSRLKVIRADEQELAAHARSLDVIDKASGGNCLWKKLEI